LALSLVGIPPLPCFLAKFLLLKGALATNIGGYQMAIAVVLIATVIETAYFLRIARLMFQEPTKKQCAEVPHRRELAPALALLVLLFVSVLNVGVIGESLTAVAEEAYINNSHLTSQYHIVAP